MLQCHLRTYMYVLHLKSSQRRPSSLIDTAPRQIRKSFAPTFTAEENQILDQYMKGEDDGGAPITPSAIRKKKLEAVATARAFGSWWR